MNFANTIFRGRTIRFKLLFYFMSLIIFPILTLSILGNFIYSKTLENETNAHTIQMLDQVNRNVEFYIRDMENVIYYLSQDPQVTRLLQFKNWSELEGSQTKNEVERMLGTFTYAHSQIAGILIATENNIYVSNEMHRIARDPLTMDKWYRQAAAGPDEIQLISKPIGRNIATEQNYSADTVVSAAKAIKDPATGKFAGVILIDMKLDIIKRIIDDIKLGKSGFVYVTDSKDGIVYAPVNPVVYRVKNQWLDSPTNSVVKEIKSNRYQIIYKDSLYTKWKTVGVFSLNETLKEVTNIRYYSLVIGLITLVLGVIAALFFTSSIAKPVRKLRSLMKKAEAGDLNVKFKSKYNDEIGQLGNSFNNMIQEIRNLIDLVYVEQKSKREAELKTLQAQIKPHFLYNTLDTIQWMAQGHGASDIVEIIGALTSLFRIGLSKGKEMIKIKEEIEHVRSYLVIQKARYEDKLEYEISCHQDIMDFHVTKLILQPIVENAIYHGIKARRGVGKIVIEAKIMENKLLFSVSDNGVGISPEKLKDINEMLVSNRPEGNKPGYGIFNVSERIRLSYGPEYGLRFYSVFGEGTTVEIWHPIIEA